MMTESPTKGSPRFERKESGGRMKVFMSPIAQSSHGGFSASIQRNNNGGSTTQPRENKEDRISEYVPVAPSTASPRGVRYHVDSLILRGKAVARNLQEASESGEVASEYRGQSVMKDAEIGGVPELPYEGFVVDHGMIGNNMEVVMLNIMGAGPSMVGSHPEERKIESVSKEKEVEDFVPLNMGNESTESTVPVVGDSLKVEAVKFDVAKLASILGQIIPGIGPASETKKLDGPIKAELVSKGNYGDGGMAMHGPAPKISVAETNTTSSFILELRNQANKAWGARGKEEVEGNLFIGGG
ncbi:hypothetical protein COLO4_30060 [Corchorus olitorius]|uniref:Uncharacterized protein n=1 Tax=Corchorus olitorius TaxID=93759 RepID=A0A1R3HBD3_9ROSI|nr:hypothetical protein COLO4_30060 [Corchorus olitorius]